MEIKISLLGILGAVFGFISIGVPWVAYQQIMTNGYNLQTVTGYFSLIDPTNPLILKDALAMIIIGSVLMILFLNTYDLNENSTNKSIKNGLFVIGIIGVILNLLAVNTFSSAMSVTRSVASISPLIVTFTMTISVGFVFGIISLIIGILNIVIFFTHIEPLTKFFIPINRNNIVIK